MSLILAISFLAFDVSAQTDDFDLITKIIQTGNARDLVKQFNNTVDLNIDGEEATYSKAQAEAVLKAFFDKSATQSFTINHKGSSKGGLPYAIGEYKNGLGTYRVWIRLNAATGKKLVSEMSIIRQ